MAKGRRVDLLDAAALERWLGAMSAELAAFKQELPTAIAVALDGTVDSLTCLERWALDNYASFEKVLDDLVALDRISRYVGEVCRHAIDGEWLVDDDKDSIYFGYLMIGVGDMIPFCPSTSVTTAIHR